MKAVVLFVLVLGSLVRPVWSADDLMTSQLVDQARQWQQKDRDDLAAEVWRKLLRTDPSHGEALVELGLIEVRADRPDEARAYLERANRKSPAPRSLGKLSSALSAAKPANNKASPPSKLEHPLPGAPLTGPKPSTGKIKPSPSTPDTPGDALILKLSTTLDRIP